MNTISPCIMGVHVVKSLVLLKALLCSSAGIVFNLLRRAAMDGLLGEAAAG